MDNLKASIFIAGSGLHAQSARLRVIAENLANANSTADQPGGEPYRRKTITFRNIFDRELNTDVVRVRKYGEDPSSFKLRYNPGHPAADPLTGYVQMPNVNSLIETMDMRQANRSYRANLQVIDVTKGMRAQTIGILR